MATYCKNHIEEEVKKLKPLTRGKIERIPTKEGMWGHLGGCNTAHDNLYQLKYDYRPAKKEESKPKETPAENTTGESTTATETTGPLTE